MLRSFTYSPSDGNGNSYSFVLSSDKKVLKEKYKKELTKYKSPLLIVDQNLPSTYIKAVEEICGLTFVNILRLNTDKKDLERVKKAWKAMVKSVPDLIVSIGGGTIGDITGFAAGTYQRGTPRIYFPTTILSMVDASIGGKTGFDFEEVKNVIGVVHYPLHVINYLPFLKTLPKREYRSGFAEIVKAAVLYDRKFFDEFDDYIKKEDILDFNNQILHKIFTTSSRLKAAICEVENNKKISLLYGHAIGHALEKVSGLQINHGEGVAIGMTIEGALACHLGVWNINQWKRQTNMIQALKLPFMIPDEVDLEKLALKMTYYKKLVSKDSYLFSLPKKIGVINNFETTCMTEISREDMIPMLRSIGTWIKKNV